MLAQKYGSTCHAFGAHRGQKAASELRELERKVVASHHVDTGAEPRSFATEANPFKN